MLVNTTAFIYVGAWMPFDTFSNTETGLEWWRLAIISILLFGLRRLPVTIALYKFMPDVKTLREATLVSHFGAIGIGAIFLSALASSVLAGDSYSDSQAQLLAQTIEPIVAFVILGSIIYHGFSVAIFFAFERLSSVPHTWSRQTSLTLIRQRTNQTRPVDSDGENLSSIWCRRQPSEASVMELGEMRRTPDMMMIVRAGGEGGRRHSARNSSIAGPSGAADNDQDDDTWSSEPDTCNNDHESQSASGAVPMHPLSSSSGAELFTSPDDTDVKPHVQASTSPDRSLVENSHPQLPQINNDFSISNPTGQVWAVASTAIPRSRNCPLESTYPPAQPTDAN
ncbi:hypothetical protein H0H92_005842 [Tricholoma furcatifolium]|nr:hypothetical protein H0H92_005842 [Tricholoma furcatifolium]